MIKMGKSFRHKWVNRIPLDVHRLSSYHLKEREKSLRFHLVLLPRHNWSLIKFYKPNHCRMYDTFSYESVIAQRDSILLITASAQCIPVYHNEGNTRRFSSVGSVSASQAAVPRSILASDTFFPGKIISLFSD